MAKQKLQGIVNNDGKRDNPANPYWKYVVSNIGRIRVDTPGKYNLTLKARLIRAEQRLGLTLVSVELVPVRD
ncbi:MAG TPA: hypothetical protein VN920_01815 [Pyrinomonadaceae bacterium]|nr:hypothetical protein [Pyrinomonadaceae bacterium]